MSRLAFLAPAGAPSGTDCIRLTFPSGDEWGTLIRGALSLLTEEYNFEQTGDVTPAEAATYFREAMLVTFQWEGCGGMPVGTFAWWTGPQGKIPGNWLVCDGSGVSATAYPALFGAIGYSHGGSGDTFNLPNMLDRFVMGAGSLAPGDTGGEASHTLLIDEIPSHHHLAPGTLNAGASSDYAKAGDSNQTRLFETTDTGGGLSHNNIPPFLVCIPCVVAK